MANPIQSFNIDSLDSILKAFKTSSKTIRIGILGTNVSRNNTTSDSTINNASVGAVHEFGSSKVPQRSFLRMPLMEKFQETLNKQQSLNEDSLKTVKSQKTLDTWLKKIAVIAVGVVLDAFATGGFGKWKAWKNPSYSNNSGMLLIDTTQLRDSITWDIR